MYTKYVPTRLLPLITIHRHASHKINNAVEKAQKNIDRALGYYDASFLPIFGSKWHSMRLALLSKKKYVAVLNNFINNNEFIAELEGQGAFNIGEMYNKELKIYTQTKKSEAARENAISYTSKTRHIERPEIRELTDDEKADLANQTSLDRYPDVYKQRLLDKHDQESAIEQDMGASRVLAPSSVHALSSAAIQDYIPATKLKGLEDWLEESDVFLEQAKGSEEIGFETETLLEPLAWPQMLVAYVFPKGNISHFPEPKRCPALQIFNSYLMDGASLFPVLALDVKPGDRVLDVCAAPGGKSMLVAQTLLTESLTSNDVSEGRVNRIRKLFKDFLPCNRSLGTHISITESNGCFLREPDAYDKILVDVPCLMDRHSMTEGDNSIFKPTRVKERLRLPELQSQLLFSALHSVKPGGSVVYSTCTLSPLQNDGSVHLALKRLWNTTSIQCTIVNMSRVLKHFSFLYKTDTRGLRYGQLILPTVLNNFGPMYIAKINRVK